MRAITNRSGFSVVELVIVLAIVAALGFVGYGVYSRQNHKTASTAPSTTGTSSQSHVAGNVSPVPSISSAGDLDKASATLDQNDPAAANDSDSNQLDSQANY